MNTYHKETLNLLVIGLTGESLASAWWNSPNKAFEDRTPQSLMNDTEWSRVKDYLMGYAYG